MRARGESEGAAAADARRARVWLGLGALLGLGIATAAILEPAPGSPGALPDDAVAVVDGQVIRRAAYERALAALARDSKDPIDEKDRRHVLDRMIDEELLVQRAVALGLDRSDPMVRNTLVSSMIESIVAGVGQQEPSAQEAADFYEANREFFARTERFWVRRLRFPVDAEGEEAALERAREATRRLRGGERASLVGRELAASAIVPLPDGYLPASKLRDYLGPTPALHAAAMQTGDVSEPIRGGSAYHVLEMVDRVPSPPLPLAAVESQVRAEMRRRAGDESLRSYLRRLRAEADVRLQRP